MRELKASMDVIRKTAGEMIDELTEKIEMMLEQKQEKLVLLLPRSCRIPFAKEESNSQHLQFIPDGTHRMQGHLFAKLWNEVERWVDAIIERRSNPERTCRASSNLSGTVLNRVLKKK